MLTRSLLFLMLILPLAYSCSTITKKDCFKDMKELGLAQGREGSPKKYTDDLRDTCMGKNPSIDLESYEKGFYQGWMEYCLPNKAYEMGKRSDRYFSFCPPERESMFREKYLLGKHVFELKDEEEELKDRLEVLKPTISTNSADSDEYHKIQKGLEKLRSEIQALEIEGAKNTFKFR